MRPKICQYRPYLTYTHTLTAQSQKQKNHLFCLFLGVSNCSAQVINIQHLKILQKILIWAETIKNLSFYVLCGKKQAKHMVTQPSSNLTMLLNFKITMAN